MPRLVLLLCLAYPLELSAGQVEEGAVSEDSGVYTLQLNAVLDVDSDRVSAIISDHPGLHRLSHVIVQSAMLDPPVPGGLRRRLMLHVCILVFCYKGPLVEDIVERGPERMTTTVVPELSDFRSGRSEWRIATLDHRRTRVRLDYVLEPAFWIPPVIGPWLIKRKMFNIAREAIDHIEALAHAG